MQMQTKESYGPFASEKAAIGWAIYFESQLGEWHVVNRGQFDPDKRSGGYWVFPLYY